MSPATYDAIVIGGGHNGLTAAAYLGRAGLRALVLERRPVVGGAVVTEEFHPGYRNSVASYILSLLRPKIIRDLDLRRHGLSLIPFRGSLDILGDGRTLLFTGDEMHDRAQVARFSNRDYESMGALRDQLQRVGHVVRDQLLREPPDLGGGLDAVLSMLRLGGGIRRLSAGACSRTSAGAPAEGQSATTPVPFHLPCHSRESGNPGQPLRRLPWTPAFTSLSRG